MALFLSEHPARQRMAPDWRFPLQPFRDWRKDPQPQFLRRPAPRAGPPVRLLRQSFSDFPRSIFVVAPRRHTGRNRLDKGWRFLAQLDQSKPSLFRSPVRELSLARVQHTKSVAAGTLRPAAQVLVAGPSND